MGLSVSNITYPAGASSPLTFDVYDTGGQPVAVALALGQQAETTIYSGGVFASGFAAKSTVTGANTQASPLHFTLLPDTVWGSSGGGPHAAMLRVSPDNLVLRRPPAIAVGKRVRYYPRVGEANFGTHGGVLVSITDASKFPTLSVNNGGVTTTAAIETIRGLGDGTPGTWAYLDFRDVRQWRLHGTHIPFLLDEFEADPTLFDFWLAKGVNWHETPINCIMQGEVNLNSPPGLPALITSWVHGSVYGALMDSNFSRAAALGIPMNFGMLTVAIMQQQSQWWSHDWWQFQADSLTHFMNRPAVKNNAHIWLELQMETVGAVFQVTDAILAANGITRAQLKAAMQPFLDAITATGLRVISRPMGGTSADGTNDVAFPLIQAAGAPGSIYCSEFQTVLSPTFRKDEFTAYHRIGGGNDAASKPARWRKYGFDMPQTSYHVQLRSGGELRMSGDVLRENSFEAHELYPLIELVELVDGWQSGVDPAPPHPLRIGAREWYYLTKIADSGTAKTSANDAQCVWTLTGDPDGLRLDVAAKRCLGKGRLTARQLRIAPWRRAVSGSVDSELSPGAQLRAPGFVCKLPGANDARCWRIAGTLWANPSTGVNTAAFALALTVYIDALPGAGVVHGLCGNAQLNSSTGSFALVLNGDQGGRLELRTRNNSGVDTFVIDAAPPVRTNHRIVFGYDLAQQKWLTASTTAASVYAAPASGKVRDPSGLALLLGGANDPANAATTVWGFPEGALAFDTEVMFWDRALTTAEATGVVQNRWPYNYSLF